MNLHNFFVPNFGFTVHLKEQTSENEIRRAIGLLNRSSPSMAYLHRTPKNDPHIHNLLWLHPERRCWFIETLFERFEAVNKKQIFKSLRERDIQVIIKKPSGFLGYASDYRNWTDKEAELIWVKVQKQFV